MIRKNFSEYLQAASDKNSDKYYELKKYLGKGRKHDIHIKFSDGKKFSEKNRGQIYTSLKSVVPLVKDHLLSKEIPSGVDLDDLDKVCRLDGWGKGVPADISILGGFISYLTGESVEVKRRGVPNEYYQGFNSGLDLSGSFIEIRNKNIEGDDLNKSYELMNEADDGSADKESGEEEEGSIADQLRQRWNIIVEGVAGSGKSHMLQELRSSGAYGSKGGRIEVVVFHPSTSYEEFVSGIRPNFMKNKENQDDFVTQEGVFIEQCNRAAVNPGKKFLLFIDEINRANTARVFGDLMLVIEDSKRVDFSKIDGDAQGESSENSAERGESDVKPQIIDLSTGKPLKVRGEEKGEEFKKGCRYGALFSAQATVPSGKDDKPAEYARLQTPIVKSGIEFNKLAVPTNLHILGTMNTTDRSVGTIDLALRRRFHWITQPPCTADELETAMKNAGENYPKEVADWYEDANTILLNQVGPDARLGHAYFFGKAGDEEAIAEALITQLLEIIFTFNIKEDILKKIGLPEIDVYNGKELGFDGQGLGRRPVVKQSEATGKTSKNSPDTAHENEVLESTDAEDSQGNQ